MSCTVPLPGSVLWWVSVSLCCSCGGVSFVCSSLTVVVGGGIVDGGVCVVVVGGIALKGGCCSADLPLCWYPRLRVGVPHLVCSVAMLNGGVRCVLLCPVFGLGPPFSIVLLPLVR